MPCPAAGGGLHTVSCRWWRATRRVLPLVEGHTPCPAAGGGPRAVSCRWWRATCRVLPLVEGHVPCPAAGGGPRAVSCRWWRAVRHVLPLVEGHAPCPALALQSPRLVSSAVTVGRPAGVRLWSGSGLCSSSSSSAAPSGRVLLP